MSKRLIAAWTLSATVLVAIGVAGIASADESGVDAPPANTVVTGEPQPDFGGIPGFPIG